MLRKEISPFTLTNRFSGHNRFESTTRRFLVVSAILIGSSWLGYNFFSETPDRHRTLQTEDPAPISGSDNLDYQPYLSAASANFKHHWHPPKANQSKRVVVAFQVLKNGEIDKLRLIKSCGIETMDQAALEAVQSASPIEPPPAKAALPLNIEYTFDYKVHTSTSR
jgi:TonB family protein